MRRRYEAQDRGDSGVIQFGALGEGAAVVLAALAEEKLHTFEAQPVQLVDGAQHAHLLAAIGDAETAQQAVEQLAVIDTKLRGNAGRLETRHGQCHHFGVGFGSIGADGIGVALDEFTQTAGPRFFVAIDRAEGVTAKRLGQAFPVLRRETGQRRRQVVAQGHPLLVVVLQSENADIRPVGVGQELAQGIGIFEGGRLQGFETEVLIDLGHGRDQPALDGDLARAFIGKAARRAGFGAEGRFGGFAHAPRLDHHA